MKKRYDSYKPSGIDWIGEIPSHWCLPRVKQFVEINNGSDPKTEGDIPVYGSGSGSFKTCGEYKVGPTVLLGRKGATLHIPHWIEGKYWNVDTAFDTRIIKGLDLRLFFYYSMLFDYQRFKSETTLPSMTQTDYGNMYIPLPPLSEQEAIAAWLDEKCGEIDSAIAKVDREIELIDELKQSEISSVVTRGLNPDAPLRPSGIDWIGDVPEHWKVVKLVYIFDAKAGGDAKPEIYVSEKDHLHPYPVYTNSLIKDQVYAYTSLAPFKAGSITVTGRGDIGHAIYRECDFDAIIRLLVLTPKRIVNCRYFTYLVDGVIEFFTDNAAVGQLSAQQISKEYIIVPPLSEQREIADYLDKKCAEIDGLKEKLIKKRETLKELRQAIISEVVTGKRKVV